MTAERVHMADYGLSGQYPGSAPGENLCIGRILAQEKGLYRLVYEAGELPAEVSGKLRFQARSAIDLPAVGDFVWADCSRAGGPAVIHGILPRKSVFLRRSAGTAHTSQVVAANIDTVFLCMSLNHDFNLRRLERYLAVAWDSGAVPVIVLTKADLCPDPAPQLRAVEECAMGVDILLTSALAEDGYRKLPSPIYTRDGPWPCWAPPEWGNPPSSTAFWVGSVCPQTACAMTTGVAIPPPGGSCSCCPGAAWSLTHPACGSWACGTQERGWTGPLPTSRPWRRSAAFGTAATQRSRAAPYRPPWNAARSPGTAGSPTGSWPRKINTLKTPGNIWPKRTKNSKTLQKSINQTEKSEE